MKDIYSLFFFVTYSVSGGGEEEEEEESVPVKVRIGKSPRKTHLPTPSASESETEDEPLGRGMKRKSAYKAGLKISEAAKRLRSDSKENESSEASSSESASAGGLRKGSVDSSDGSGTAIKSSKPKRTRLQRMNTNRCGDSGDLDNVLLDKLVMDLMRHPDAWPFLKPVTRSDVRFCLFSSSFLPLFNSETNIPGVH